MHVHHFNIFTPLFFINQSCLFWTIYYPLFKQIASARVINMVTRSGHPSRCWPHLPLLNLRDQERHHRIARKTSSLAMQHKFPLILTATLSLFSGKLHPGAWCEFSLDVWQCNGFRVHNDTPVAPGRHTSEHMPFFFSDDFHCRLRTTPRPYKTHPEEGFPLNTRIPPLPPVVTCSSHPSKYWPRSLLLNLRDQERHSTASPER
jgi:hypothetical protein